MSNFNDEKIDKMLKAYCTRSDETFTFNKPKKIKHTALIAACLVLVILAGVIFVPHLFPTQNTSGFIIVANAKSLDETGLASADEITKEYYVELENPTGNVVFFDYDEILNPDAPGYNLTQRYLFQSFATNLNINVVGEDIKTITYKFNKGAITPVCTPIEHIEDGKDNMVFSYGFCCTEVTFDKKPDEIFILGFNPVYNPDATYELSRMYYSSPDAIVKYHHSFLETRNYVFSENYGELEAQYGWEKSLSYGYRSSDPPLANEEEINTLRELSQADDMLGFFNYQNQIFKRLVDGTTIDITVTYNSGASETKTIELIYTPIEATDIEWYSKEPANTNSNGIISARLK